jgi:hypothetical protein|tara:strand:+ start:1559 stop:1993 length:435 start_codon:yes stop_codon:yes gene_type:complete
MKKQIIKDPTYNIYSKGGNVEKAIPGRGDGSAKKELADLEKVEFDVFKNLADTIKEDFEKEKQPGQKFIDWLKTKPDSYFKLIKLKKGGTVVSISDYLKQKEDIPIKKIDLASYFTPGKTLASLTDAEREVVNQLLKMSLGKKD